MTRRALLLAAALAWPGVAWGQTPGTIMDKLILVIPPNAKSVTITSGGYNKTLDVKPGWTIEITSGGHGGGPGIAAGITAEELEKQ